METKKSIRQIEQSNQKKIKVTQNSIQVYCRFRPVSNSEKESSYYDFPEDETSIRILAPTDILASNKGIDKYVFTKVFQSDKSQQVIFSDCIFPVLQKLIKTGKNALVFTYGVTNAGKSFTIVGDDQNPGVLPNTISWLLSMKNSLFSKEKTQQQIFQMNEIKLEECFFKQKCFIEKDIIENYEIKDLKLQLQCFEIYNDELHDLFCKKGMKQKKKKLLIKEVNKKLIIENLKSAEIQNFEGAKKLLQMCLQNRHILQTNLNKSSSRSHCVYKIILSFIFESEDDQIEVEKCLNLVDLAGSERAKRTENQGQKLKEANKINQSLSCLQRCIQALSKKQMAPYRETKLTRYLSEFFEQDNNVIMIANINPREKDFEESLRALNYTSVAKEIKFIPSRYSSTSFVYNRISKDKGQIYAKDNNINEEITRMNIPSSKPQYPMINQQQFLELNEKIEQNNKLLIKQEKNIQKILKLLQRSSISPEKNQPRRSKSLRERELKGILQSINRNKRKVDKIEDCIKVFDKHEDYQQFTMKEIQVICEKAEQTENQKKLRILKNQSKQQLQQIINNK